MMKIEFSNIVTAFSPNTIGTKVINRDAFLATLEKAIAEHDFDADRVPGQGYVPIDAIPFVSAGVGPRTQDPEDYVLRCHRGLVSPYLKRHKAASVDGVAAIVYTRYAYLADPDIDEDPSERGRIEASDCTHVLVAVLAFAGPKSTYSPTRFTANLAGGNREALVWAADEIRAKAKEVNDYHQAWCEVAD